MTAKHHVTLSGKKGLNRYLQLAWIRDLSAN